MKCLYCPQGGHLLKNSIKKTKQVNQQAGEEKGLRSVFFSQVTHILFIPYFNFYLLSSSVSISVSVCPKSLRKWTQTDTKVTFHPPPTRKLNLVSNKRYGKNKTFLLRWYGIDFAPIKRYRPFCFLWLYIRRQRLSLYDLSTLCP